MENNISGINNTGEVNTGANKASSKQAPETKSEKISNPNAQVIGSSNSSAGQAMVEMQNDSKSVGFEGIELIEDYSPDQLATLTRVASRKILDYENRQRVAEHIAGSNLFAEKLIGAELYRNAA